MQKSFPRNYDRPDTVLYTMLVQNTASREVFILPTLENLSASPLYYTFDIQMPEAAQAGEYCYYLIPQTPKMAISPDSQPLLSKVEQEDGTTVLLRDLRPEIGLLMYKTTNADPNIYPERQSSFIYYEKK